MEYINIENINAPELAVYTKLSENQLYHYYEPDIGVFVSESANVVLRALEAGYEPISLLVESHRIEKEARPVIEFIEQHYPENDVKIYIADHEMVKDLTGYALVRGLWAVLRRKPLEKLLDFCKDKKKLAVLYDTMNPTNAGAIIRSAVALGVEGVVLTSSSVNPLSRRSTRVSMGTVFQVPWTMALPDENGSELIKRLHSYGFKTAAMALSDDSISVDNKILKTIDRLAIVMGTEGDGLPQDVIRECTYTVKIPMYNNVDSLNVAAASAVAFWEILSC